MLLDVHKISLIYDFWKSNNGETYLHDASELSRKLTDSDAIDAEYIRDWVPDLLRLVELWEEQSLDDLNHFYQDLLLNHSSSDKIDALLRFLYGIQTYELVKYLLEKNVEYYKKHKLVSSAMTGFHESSIYGFSHVCMLYIRNGQDVNATFSLFYGNSKNTKKEIIRNLTALQLACLWSKYFPKRLLSYAHTVRILLNHGARVNLISTDLTTPLHWTCRAKHTTQLAQDLIEHGASINARDRLNIQPIHYACWTRNQVLVELLLAKGAQLTDQDELGRTPLHYLCMPTCIEVILPDDQEQQYELMKNLIHRSPIDLTKIDSQGHTIFAYACASHNLPLMELILQRQTDLLNKATIDGRTPLIIAIDECFINGIEYLLKQPRLERNVGDQLGNTAIHHACMCVNPTMRVNILRLLIDDENGIFDLEKRNEKLVDPLMVCTMKQSMDLFQLLVEKNVSLIKKDIYSRQALHLACQLGNYEFVFRLISSSTVEINAIDNHNRNCLFYAIDSGNEKIVDLLLERNVQIKLRDQAGDTPLHLAVRHAKNAHRLTASLLKQSDGKDLINEPALDGMKPILLAANFKQADVVHLLIKNGADLTAVDIEHHNALHIACRSGCMKSAFYLIEFGGLDVNELDCYRQTPIFYAYPTNDYVLVEYLISCGAQIDLRDTQNYLPFHMGILLAKSDEDFDPRLIDLYKEKHEDLLDDQNNEAQMTPLILACMQGKFDIVQYLISNYRVDILSTCANGHTALHYACLTKNSKSIELIEFLMEHGCTYEKVDQPKGAFLYTVIQRGERDAAWFFLDYWMKNNPNVNELHYGATLLDLLVGRAQIYDHDIDVEHIRHVLDRGAQLYLAQIPIYPCLLANDCPQFYLILLEYNCSNIEDKLFFIFQLLDSVSKHSENTLVWNKKDQDSISTCDYFLKVVQLAHYYYQINRLYGTIDQRFLPKLTTQQPSEQIDRLRTQLEQLRSTPLKLSQIARKVIHQKIDLPCKSHLKQLGLTGHLVDFLVQTAF